MTTTTTAERAAEAGETAVEVALVKVVGLETAAQRVEREAVSGLVKGREVDLEAEKAAVGREPGYLAGWVVLAVFVGLFDQTARTVARLATEVERADSGVGRVCTLTEARPGQSRNRRWLDRSTPSHRRLGTGREAQC